MARVSSKNPSFLMLVLISCCLLFQSSVFASTQKCIHQHFSALLDLKNGFDFYPSSFSTLSTWNSNNTDCCSWEGITCDGATGHVISLDLGSFHISGRIDFESLFHLWSLQRLSLADNYFDSSPIPSGFDKLISLTHLNLSRLYFYGQIPLEISLLTSLVSLDLSFNYYYNESGLLTLKLENPSIAVLFQNMSSLRELHLDSANFPAEGSEWGQALFSSLPRLHKLSLQYCELSRPIHSSLSKLRFLSELDLSYNNLSSVMPNFPRNLRKLSLRNCGLLGPIQSSLSKLRFLSELYINGNNLSGPLPSFLVNLSKLEYLDLSFNSLSGPIPSSYGNKLLNLKGIILGSNLLNGTIPSSLFSLPSLRMLDLKRNELGGWLDVIHNASSTQLEFIYLGDNNLQGMVPSFIFKLTKLRTVSLSFNNFSGVVELGLFQNLKNLSLLDLSNNNLSVKDGGGNSAFFDFPQIIELSLRSCNMRKFPNFLQNQEQMQSLDLSNNRITGVIPKWIWKVGNETSYYLNLSHNALQRIEPPFSHVPLSNWVVLDLSSNRLEGSLPIPSPSTSFFSLSNNSLSGEIPVAICNITSLQVLNLSRNRLTGWIPQCLSEISDVLNVLNLRGNAFNGALLQSFKEGCSVQTLDLSENQLEGQVPRSLANCTMLEVLNLGNNQINDTFPSWVDTLSQLRILVLKSNKFYGPITLRRTNQSFRMLQIIDLSSNSFMGGLPSNMFQSWKAMMEEDKSQSKFLGRIVTSTQNTVYYQDTVAVTIKGLERELTKILTIFTAVDLSNNYFQGDIPASLGILKSLRLLNMSRNGFTGQIPTSLENLTVLESLDLSQNYISGEIPWQLTKLTFLSVLNLSQNHLVGSIPQIKQFFTFTNESFQENSGLCGPPLSRKCIAPPSVIPTFEVATSELNWEFMWIGFGVGYGVGMGAFFWTLALWTKGSIEYNRFIDRMLSLIFPSAIFAPKRRPQVHLSYGYSWCLTCLRKVMAIHGS